MPVVRRFCKGCHKPLLGYAERKRARCDACEQRRSQHPWKTDR
mgnify:CR=1 FL=1